MVAPVKYISAAADIAPLIVIVGPTASGKSDLAMRVARQCHGEIICADSRTVYRGMDIGTAKPSAADRQEIPHHLLDVVEPGESFSAAQFKQRALRAINEIWQRGHMPILVGGSGLYVDAVIFDYQFRPPPSFELRRKLQALDENDLRELCFNNNIPLPVNHHNRRHLVRAIELGGLVQDKKMLRPQTIVVGITTGKDQLRARIVARARTMLQKNVLSEIERLGKYYGWSNEAMTAGIYRVFEGVVKGTMSIDEGFSLFVQSDLNLAKRQLTWFKRNPHIRWSHDPNILLCEIDNFMQSLHTLSPQSLIQ